MEKLYFKLLVGSFLLLLIASSSLAITVKVYDGIKTHVNPSFGTQKYFGSQWLWATWRGRTFKCNILEIKKIVVLSAMQDGRCRVRVSVHTPPSHRDAIKYGKMPDYLWDYEYQLSNAYFQIIYPTSPEERRNGFFLFNNDEYKKHFYLKNIEWLTVGK
ncbi:MAG: hypothetical protein JRC68_08745 [Deltaproteobacteria bacterium]|nr:hypothetical protein [Deltaproteobacteria bacterium]